MTVPGGREQGAGTGATRRVVLVVEQLRRRVPGGIGRYITGLLQGLGQMADGGERIPDIVLVASRPPAGPDPLTRFGFELAVSRLPGPVMTRAWDRGWGPAPARGDVVHGLSLSAPPTRGAPLVVTVHDLAWRQVPEAYPERGRRWHEDAFVRAGRGAAALVAPSAETADDITAAGAAAPVTVITHGTDHLGVADQAGADALLARLGVEGDFLLSVGTLEPRKNLVRLVEAYRRARSQLPTELTLVVVGPDGWGGTPLWLSGSAPVPGVVPTGPVDDATLSALYQRARLLAYVPLREGFGFPPVEAMRAGIPVVASPMPSLGGAGLMVDPTDIDALSTALVRAATDEAVRQALVAQGSQRVAPLTWAAAARAHVALWESVA